MGRSNITAHTAISARPIPSTIEPAMRIQKFLRGPTTGVVLAVLAVVVGASAGGGGALKLVADLLGRGGATVTSAVTAGGCAFVGAGGTAGTAGALALAAGGVEERWTGGPPTKRGLGTAGAVADVFAGESLGAEGRGGCMRGGASERSSSSTSNAELAGVSPKRSEGLSTSVAVGRSDFCSVASLNAGGGFTITMPPHLGHERI